MQDTTKSDLKETVWHSMEWTHLAQNRDQRGDLLNVIMRLGVPEDAGIVFPRRAKHYLFQTDSAPCSQPISHLGR